MQTKHMKIKWSNVTKEQNGIISSGILCLPLPAIFKKRKLEVEMIYFKN